ncbi:hypothetical protein [Aeromicrobium sp. UC242_57]|uniref:hypothetical protein n=1 Tax=Aeromicrobium sp. UC242_57 TaxID=3374624 RepID=UPI0037902984
MSAQTHERTRPVVVGRGSRPGWHRRYGRRLMVSDAAVLAWVFVMNHVVWSAVPQWDEAQSATSTSWVLTSVGLAVTWHLALTLSGTRDSRVLGAGPEEYKRIINCTIVVFSVIAFVGYVFSLTVPRS